MVTRQFTVGSFCFQLTAPESLTLPVNFLQFETRSGTPRRHYTLRVADALPAFPGNIPVAATEELAVFKTPDGEQRFFGIRGTGMYFAASTELADNRTEITLLPFWAERLHIDTMFVSLLSLERHLLEDGALVLHSAYIRYNTAAILFSAPSETGKSTQAGLWEQYRGAETVNGDRSLLYECGGVWTANPWPVCGSSEICRMESHPIRAIVMLRQAADNTVRRLRPGEAFRLLYPQITVNSWSADAVQRAADRIEALISAVPVYGLGCTISKEAVSVLAAEIL